MLGTGTTAIELTRIATIVTKDSRAALHMFRYKPPGYKYYFIQHHNKKRGHVTTVKQVMIKKEGEDQVAARNARLAFKGNKNRHYELLELDYSIAHELDPDQRCRHCGEGHNKAWWCAEKCLLGWYASPRERHPRCGCVSCKPRL
jgi:hypothetical protein